MPTTVSSSAIVTAAGATARGRLSVASSSTAISLTVARELLGKLLIRREGRTLLAGRVVEDEAYLGKDDPAAHAYRRPDRAQLRCSSGRPDTRMSISSTAITIA